MKPNKCVECGRDLSLWGEKNENLKGRTWSGVINHTCPDCVYKECAKYFEERRTEIIQKAKVKKWKLCCFSWGGSANEPMSYADWVCVGIVAAIVIPLVITIMSYIKP